MCGGGWALSPLPPGDRAAITSETRSHLYERGMQGEAALEAALNAFGPPEDYARAFIDEFSLVEISSASGAWPLLRTGAAHATRSISGFLGALVFGLLYLVSFALLLVAIMKPILPRQTGLFVGRDVFGLGIVDAASASHARELLGYWVVPIALAGSLLVYAAATLLLRGFLKRLLKSDARSNRF